MKNFVKLNKWNDFVPNIKLNWYFKFPQIRFVKYNFFFKEYFIKFYNLGSVSLFE